MLLHYRPVPAKIPKRRSRAGCIHCKEKKKKCNEERPQCDRCMERGLKCQYEPVKPRKRRRTTTAIEQDQQRARSVTSDPGPQTGFHNGPHGPIPNGVRSVLADFRHHSSSSSNLDDPWDDESGSAYDSPNSSVGELILDGGDGLPPLHELDEPIQCATPVLPSSCTSADFRHAPTTAGPPLSADYGRARFSRSPTTGEFVPPSSRADGSFSDHLGGMTPTITSSPIDFHSPAYSEFSQRKNRQVLLDHFCSGLSHLFVFKEEPGNPFRDFILPMATRSLPVMNAVYAVSAAHMEHRGIDNEERSLDFHSRTLQGLAHLIADQKTTRDEALAVIILLLYYEVVRSGSSVVLSSHLRGALSIIRERRPSHGPTCAHLEKAFRYLDVICALSFGTSPMSGSVNPTSASVPLSPQEMTAMSAVDTQFGLVGDLWPMLHRLAHLHDLRQEIDRRQQQSPGRIEPMKQDLETQAATMELALHQWAPKLGHASGLVSPDTSMEDARLQSILSNAEAYKQSAFVYLFRSVHNYPRKAPKVQHHAKQSLKACLRVIIFQGPMTGLLWPLFTAACEAVEDVDRNVARTVFRLVELRHGMQNIMHAWKVVEEVWQRVDEGDADMEWRTVCQERDRAVVLG
ncbi:MAG: hypothetical protein M1832_003705 [Thelocarpon impressellum]|nr:MAG: hypothetical protein M1832_003705 [Thelocarpon impressellum]